MKNSAGLLLLLIIASCSTQENKKSDTQLADKKALIQADINFSKMSAEKGMKSAFIDYIDSNGVLLRPNHLPIIGANAIDYLIQENDSGYVLTWEPQYAEAASSGDLGYTYGIYQLHIKSKDSSIYGSYISVWKKQKDGKWKFVLDSGNEGLGEE
ncbi:MAG: hypothetical protein JST81_12160 [Bacteroidetes bacterium]|nr:hypothetical protein [Bacteroidota bacterium]